MSAIPLSGGFVDPIASEIPDLRGLGAPTGNDGRTPEFQKSLTHVQWRWVGDSTWINLVPLADLTGATGSSAYQLWIADGNAGDIAAFLASLIGPAGPPVQLQKTATHVQWRPSVAFDWTNLYALTEVKGDQGEEGEPGTPAAPPAFTVGSVTTVANGTPADVDVSGAAPNFVFDFVIPAGPGGTVDISRSQKSSASSIVVGDKAKLIEATTGTWQLDLLAAATAGATFWFFFRNTGTGAITIEPDGAETIDGRSGIRAYPGEGFLIQCDGTNWLTVGRSRLVRLGEVINPATVAAIDFDLFGGDTEINALHFEVFDHNQSARILVKKSGAYQTTLTQYNLQSLSATGASLSATTSNAAVQVGQFTRGEGSIVNINSALASSQTIRLRTDALSSALAFVSGWETTAAAITGLRIAASSGNFTAGTFRVWGERR